MSPIPSSDDHVTQGRNAAWPRDEVERAFGAVVREPNDECSMRRWLAMIGGDTGGMCSGPVMYEARLLSASDWSIRYHLCVGCAAEFRAEGKHEIRTRTPESEGSST